MSCLEVEVEVSRFPGGEGKSDKVKVTSACWWSHQTGLIIRAKLNTCPFFPVCLVFAVAEASSTQHVSGTRTLDSLCHAL